MKAAQAFFAWSDNGKGARSWHLWEWITRGLNTELFRWAMASELKVSLSLAVRLLAGERVLYFKPIVWGASGKSFPSYRLSLSFPFIQEMGLYITDRRVLLPCWLLRLVRFEWSAWFTGKDQTVDEDHLEAVAIGRNAFFGPYLELITYNCVEHWWRSRKARVRLFMKNPEPVCRLISQALGPATPRGE